MRLKWTERARQQLSEIRLKARLGLAVDARDTPIIPRPNPRFPSAYFC